MIPDIRRVLNINYQTKGRLCGHKTPWKGRVQAFGAHTRTKMPLNKDGTVDFCLRCLGTMAIRCAWCSRPIFVGDFVTLYLVPEGKLAAKHAVIYELQPKGRISAVGCGHVYCADSGADYCGTWVPAGIQWAGSWVGGVERFENGYERAMKGHDVVIMDFSDPSKLGPFAEVQLPVMFQSA